MRRGNGDGSIFKLGGKRRKPYAVRVTVGWNDEGKQIYKYLGYFEKKTEAKKLLNQYLTAPNSIATNKSKLCDVFENMITSSTKFKEGTINQYRFGFTKLKPLHNKNIDKITLEDIEEIFKQEKSSGQTVIKRVLSNCYKYALKHQLATKDLATFLEPSTVNPNEKRKKVPFTQEEINHLWNTYESLENGDIMLMFLYTGMRTVELFNIECSNINLAEMWIDIKKSKTNAGIRRLPIHHKILPLIKKRVENGHKYLITNRKNNKMTYMNYYDHYWYSKNHTIHETRHTFITALDKLNIDRITIKSLIGHSDKDVTDRYIHRTQAELLDVINQIKL